MNPTAAASVNARRSAPVTNVALVAERLSTAVREQLEIRRPELTKVNKFKHKGTLAPTARSLYRDVLVDVCPSFTWFMKLRTS